MERQDTTEEVEVTRDDLFKWLNRWKLQRGGGQETAGGEKQNAEMVPTRRSHTILIKSNVILEVISAIL